MNQSNFNNNNNNGSGAGADLEVINRLETGISRLQNLFGQLNGPLATNHIITSEFAGLSMCTQQIRQERDAAEYEIYRLRQEMNSAHESLRALLKIIERFSSVEDPVVASDGYTYERRDISRYFDECEKSKTPAKSHLTQEDLNTSTLVSNLSMRRMMNLLQEVEIPVAATIDPATQQQQQQVQQQQPHQPFSSGGGQSFPYFGSQQYHHNAHLFQLHHRGGGGGVTHQPYNNINNNNQQQQQTSSRDGTPPPNNNNTQQQQNNNNNNPTSTNSSGGATVVPSNSNNNNNSSNSPGIAYNSTQRRRSSGGENLMNGGNGNGGSNKGSRRASLQQPLSGKLHPCIRVYGHCKFEDECVFASYPYECCLSHLKGKCRFGSTCLEPHLPFQGDKAYGERQGIHFRNESDSVTSSQNQSRRTSHSQN